MSRRSGFTILADIDPAVAIAGLAPAANAA